MGLLAKDKGGTDYEPLTPGMHHAVCYGIVDLGTQDSGQFEPKRKVAFLWEVPSERIQFEKDGKKHDLPRGISGIWTLSLHKKSTMRPMLESWRGRPFTDEELKGFDLKNIIGANCFLNVVQKRGSGQNSDKVYANVASVNPLAKGMAKLPCENQPVFFSIDDCEDVIVVPEGIPDWLKTKIMQSEEYVKEQKQDSQDRRAPSEEEMANTSSSNIEDEIPF